MSEMSYGSSKESSARNALIWESEAVVSTGKREVGPIGVSAHLATYPSHKRAQPDDTPLHTVGPVHHGLASEARSTACATSTL
jgi:hypothetical protein